MAQSQRATGGRGLKREHDEDEDTLFMSKEKLKIELFPTGAHCEEEEDSQEEKQSEDDEDDLHALDEQIRERLEDFDSPYDPEIEGFLIRLFTHGLSEQSRSTWTSFKRTSIFYKVPYSNPETARLAAMGMSIKDIKYSAGTKVALIGNSGVGMMPRTQMYQEHRLMSIRDKARSLTRFSTCLN